MSSGPTTGDLMLDDKTNNVVIGLVSMVPMVLWCGGMVWCDGLVKFCMV